MVGQHRWIRRSKKNRLVPLRLPWKTLRLLIVLILPLWGGMVGGCRSSEPAPRVVCDDCNAAHFFVRSQAPAQSVEPGTECATSARLSTDEWKKILHTIRVQPKAHGFVFGSSKGPVETAFTSEEIDYLSKALGPAFRQARPNDMIVFGLTRSRSSDVEEITTGGWCVQEANLMLLLTNYRVAVSMPRIHDLLWKEPLRSHVADAYEFVAGDYQTINLDINLRGYRQKAGSTLSILYQPLLASSRTSSEPTDMAPHNTPMSLEERLQRLKRIYEQGLIAEEEYRSKKQEIIERL